MRIGVDPDRYREDLALGQAIAVDEVLEDIDYCIPATVIAKLQRLPHLARMVPENLAQNDPELCGLHCYPVPAIWPRPENL